MGFGDFSLNLLVYDLRYSKNGFKKLTHTLMGTRLFLTKGARIYNGKKVSSISDAGRTGQPSTKE